MKRILNISILLLLCVNAFARLSITEQTVEGLHQPIGLDVAIPKFSWAISSTEKNTLQTAYELIVYDASRKVVWNSGKIQSSESVNVPYCGSNIRSNSTYFWKVRVWDNYKNTSSWSNLKSWHTGFFDDSDWEAQWIENKQMQGEETRSPYFRKEFNSTGTIASAYLYVTSHGLYQAFINGEKVGNDCLTPGFTSYNNRLQYQVYNVTQLLQKGENAIGAILGNGWYRGTINWEPRQMIYGEHLGLLCQLEIEYSDGTRARVISDNSWKTSFGAIQYAEIYNGETIDSNKEVVGWNFAKFNDSTWSQVEVANYDFKNLISTYNQPVKQQEVFTSSQVITTPKGEKVIDYGQNLVGWEKVKIKGNKGDTIRIYHAEVLDKEGNFYTANLRAAKAMSTYILSGFEDVFEPHFTFYGFRYIKIEGVKGEIIPEDYKAIALYSDMPKNGSFTSSNPLINQLQSNIEWGQKGNFIDIPTDCPQRNERLGWTGDAHAFFRTAVFNRNGYNFFKKWLKDLAADQFADGCIPWVIPHTLREDQSGSTGWGDAATIIPWQLFMAYNDTIVLKEQYNSMKGWVNYMKNNSIDNLWNTKKHHFGDWLFYRPDDDKDGIAAITDKYMIAQCFYAHSTQLLINTARVLNYKEDEKEYSDLLMRIKEAYRNEYMTSNGGLVSNTQTAYVLALQFDMLPENLRTQAVERLVRNVERYNYHITTGFLGTSYICHVLSRFGRTDVAYKLLLQETYPSWLYPVKAGATTIWERWDGRKPDGTFQTDEMNSFNHYAYGAIGDWLYRVCAGITEVAPGYKEISIKPHLGGDFTFMEAKQMTPYGECLSSWKLTGKKLEMNVTIPVNTTATLYIPENDSYKCVKVGSGTYYFTSTIF